MGAEKGEHPVDLRSPVKRAGFEEPKGKIQKKIAILVQSMSAPNLQNSEGKTIADKVRIQNPPLFQWGRKKENTPSI